MNRHEGITCRSCNKQNFTGRCYCCLICTDFHMCLDCYEQDFATPTHLYDHPVKCLYTPSELQLYFGGEHIVGQSAPQSYRCPYCKSWGFTESTFLSHLSEAHTNVSSYLVSTILAIYEENLARSGVGRLKKLPARNVQHNPADIVLYLRKLNPDGSYITGRNAVVGRESTPNVDNERRGEQRAADAATSQIDRRGGGGGGGGVGGDGGSAAGGIGTANTGPSGSGCSHTANKRSHGTSSTKRRCSMEDFNDFARSGCNFDQFSLPSISESRGSSIGNQPISAITDRERNTIRFMMQQANSMDATSNNMINDMMRMYNQVNRLDRQAGSRIVPWLDSHLPPSGLISGGRSSGRHARILGTSMQPQNVPRPFFMTSQNFLAKRAREGRHQANNLENSTVPTVVMRRSGISGDNSRASDTTLDMHLNYDLDGPFWGNNILVVPEEAREAEAMSPEQKKREKERKRALCYKFLNNTQTRDPEQQRIFLLQRSEFVAQLIGSALCVNQLEMPEPVPVAEPQPIIETLPEVNPETDLIIIAPRKSPDSGPQKCDPRSNAEFVGAGDAEIA